MVSRTWVEKTLQKNGGLRQIKSHIGIGVIPDRNFVDNVPRQDNVVLPICDIGVAELVTIKETVEWSTVSTYTNANGTSDITHAHRTKALRLRPFLRERASTSVVFKKEDAESDAVEYEFLRQTLLLLFNFCGDTRVDIPEMRRELPLEYPRPESTHGVLFSFWTNSLVGFLVDLRNRSLLKQCCSSMNSIGFS